MTGFDWPVLMRAGLGGLGLSPDVFWALTPRELQLLLGLDAQAPLNRAGLNDLMRAFPDRPDVATTRETGGSHGP